MDESGVSVNSDMNFALKNGINMPAVGFGTFRLDDYNLLYKTIDYALDAGYRLFDTSPTIGNEKLLKRAFQILLPQHGLAREDIFITTKLSPFCTGSNAIAGAFEKSLENLGLEYIDLYLISYPGKPTSHHTSPKHATVRHESWLALVKLYNEGKVRAIGVSNFTVRHLMQLTEVMALGPMVNQVEWHPYYCQPDMLQYCCEHNIRIQAYHSLGGLSRGNRELLDDPVVLEVAQKHNATSAQVLLRWALQNGVAVIPNSTNPYHIKDNKKLNFTLSEYDIMVLDQLSAKNQKYAWDPSGIA